MNNAVFKGRVGEMSEVCRSRGELYLKWMIPRFLDLTGGGGDCYVSPAFSFSDARWRLVVTPNHNASGWVTVGLHRQDPGTSTKTVNLVFGIRASGAVKNLKEMEVEVKQRGCSGVYKFCSRSELREQGLMTEEALTIVCQLKARSATATDTDKLSEDLGKLLASGEKSDVSVQVGGVDIPVHSAILFARCPALSISLRHESAESTSNRIVVEDIEPDIFRDFLHFLYTGSVQSLTKDNAFALYRIADRYLTDDLKRLCLEHIKDALSVDTFCDAVRLAKMYEENGLMDQAVDFAAQNIQSILSSEEWRNFNRECPDEANEVLLKFVVPPSKRQKTSR